MASLLTQCPHCQTSFRVSRTQLAVAEGQVRCGSCLGVFSARDNEIRVKLPMPPLLDEPLTEEELSSVAAADEDDDFDDTDADFIAEPPSADADEYLEYEDAPPPRERSGSWLDDDEDDIEYEDEERGAAPQAPALSVEDEIDIAEDEDEVREDEEEITEYADDRNRADEEYTEEEYADEYDANEPVFREPVLGEPVLREPVMREPVLREPTLSRADAEPRFSADTERDGPTEPTFSLFPDTDEVEPGFSAIDGDDEDDYRSVRSRYAAPARDDDKRQVRRYLDGIENEDALDELSPDTLDYLDDEPVHIAPSPAPRRFWGSLLLGLGSLALIAVLALQFVGSHVDELNQSARFTLLRPLLCGVLDCPPAPQAPSTLVSEQLVVRSHPTLRDALEVTAVLRNNGAATQPLPGVELIFRDAQDQIVASRIFTPQQYLPPELRTASELPSQSSVQVHMELTNPGPEALNYELAFRPLADGAAP